MAEEEKQTTQLSLIRQQLELLNNMYSVTNGEQLQTKIIKEIGLTQRDAIAQGMPGAMKEQLSEMRAMVQNGKIANDLFRDLDNIQSDIADKIEGSFPEQNEAQPPEQQDEAQGFAAVLKKYLGSPGDYKQFRDKLSSGFDSLKKIPEAINNLPGMKGIKDGIGAFFEVIKTGLLLIGGLVGLQGFLDGLNRIDDFFEGTDYSSIVKTLAAGLTGVVDAFVGLDPEQELAVATGVANMLQTVVDFIKRLGEAFGRVTGIIESENESLLTTVTDYALVIGALGLYFKGPLLAIVKFIPVIFGMLSSFFSTMLLPAIGGILTALGPLLVPIALLIVGIGFLIKDIMDAAESVGGIGNLIKLAFATIQDMFINLINGAISLANKIPGVNIDLLEGGGNVERVKAQIEADKSAMAAETADAIDEGSARQTNGILGGDISQVMNQINQNNVSNVEINAGKIPQTNIGESLGLTGTLTMPTN